MEADLEKLEKDLKDYIGTQFVQMDSKFVQMDSKFEQMNLKFEQMDLKFATKEKVNEIGTDVAVIRNIMTNKNQTCGGWLEYQLVPQEFWLKYWGWLSN